MNNTQNRTHLTGTPRMCL